MDVEDDVYDADGDVDDDAIICLSFSLLFIFLLSVPLTNLLLMSAWS